MKRLRTISDKLLETFMFLGSIVMYTIIGGIVIGFSDLILPGKNSYFDLAIWIQLPIDFLFGLLVVEFFRRKFAKD